MRKRCNSCKKIAKYYYKKDDEVIYLCEEHARKLLIEGKVNYLPKL